MADAPYITLRSCISVLLNSPFWWKAYFLKHLHQKIQMNSALPKGNCKCHYFMRHRYPNSSPKTLSLVVEVVVRHRYPNSTKVFYVVWVLQLPNRQKRNLCIDSKDLWIIHVFYNNLVAKSSHATFFCLVEGRRSCRIHGSQVRHPRRSRSSNFNHHPRLLAKVYHNRQPFLFIFLPH